MKANELRIGNLVDLDGKPYKVDAIIQLPNYPFFELYVEGIDYDYALRAEPITLTEEWLLKLGFWKQKIQPTVFISPTARPRFEIHQTGMAYPFDVMLDNNGPYLCTPKYVHQLQNLYFALIGEELTIIQ